MSIKITENDTNIALVDIEDALKTVYDPDMEEFSIYDLGLIYEIILKHNQVDIIMTLTSPSCIEAENLPVNAKESIIHKLNNPAIIVNVDVVFDPPWTLDNMSDETLSKLGLL